MRAINIERLKNIGIENTVVINTYMIVCRNKGTKWFEDIVILLENIVHRIVTVQISQVIRIKAVTYSSRFQVAGIVATYFCNIQVVSVANIGNGTMVELTYVA